MDLPPWTPMDQKTCSITPQAITARSFSPAQKASCPRENINQRTAQINSCQTTHRALGGRHHDLKTKSSSFTSRRWTEKPILHADKAWSKNQSIHVSSFKPTLVSLSCTSQTHDHLWQRPWESWAHENQSRSGHALLLLWTFSQLWARYCRKYDRPCTKIFPKEDRFW